jgi:beta-N-acetylhexosaminidase
MSEWRFGGEGRFCGLINGEKNNILYSRLMIDIAATELTDGDCVRLQNPAIGGVILFARNYENASQLRALCAAIRAAAGRPILIATDQEGGDVQRFCGGGFTRLPAAGDLGGIAGKDGEEVCDAACFAAGYLMASELRAADVDLSFAPVLDLGGKSEVIGRRAFGELPAQVIRRAEQFADGMAAAGMQCCGKHYPGHGGARADSHKTLPVDKRDFAALISRDIIPFGKFIAAKHPALMSAHVVYPMVDDAAATFSRKWLHDILRGELNFGGLMLSDDLAMTGAVAAGGEDAFARMRAARNAGCDLLLFCAASQKRFAEDDALWRGLAAAADEMTKKGMEKNPWRMLAPAAASGDGAARAERGLKYLRENGLIG